MEDFAISWGMVASILSAIVLTGGASAYIIKVFNTLIKPRRELEARALKLEEKFQQQENKIHRLEETLRAYTNQRANENKGLIEEIREDISHLKKELKNSKAESVLILNSLLAIGNHLVTNDSVDKIESVNESILSFLIESRDDK